MDTNKDFTEISINLIIIEISQNIFLNDVTQILRSVAKVVVFSIASSIVKVRIGSPIISIIFEFMYL